jgi:hypothetical protein
MHIPTRIGILLTISLLCVSLISACTGTSSDNRYSRDLNTVLDKYNTWSAGILATYHRLLEAPTEYDPGQTYGDLIMGTLYSFQSGKGVPPGQNWNQLDINIFQGTVQMLYDDAREILTLMDTMTPPDEVAGAHQQLYACLEYHANIAASMLLIFTEGRYEQLNYMSNPCDQVETALSTLTQYLQQNPAH